MLNKRLFNKDTELAAYSEVVWRMVNTQEGAATLHIVDNMEEQALLEEMLDRVKPAYRAGTENMHYLLRTAFRYPPLKFGSRFGTRSMPSFFYASEQAQTCLAESAYYRFMLLDDMLEPYGSVIDSRHCLFSIRVRTASCLCLDSDRFESIRKKLRDPNDYALCQSIGEWAIQSKRIEMIRFESARQSNTRNVALAEPAVIVSKSPLVTQSWLCRTTAETVSFSSRDAAFPANFHRSKH